MIQAVAVAVSRLRGLAAPRGTAGATPRDRVTRETTQPHTHMQRFINWDALEIRVDGARINALASTFRVDPIERMELQFFNGLLRVTGSIRKFISVPFTVDIREIRAKGRIVRVPIASASAFGALPIPQFLFSLAKNRLPADLVRFEEPATFVVSLDRFLPSFVDAEIENIWIIDGGLAVTLGRGGADLPPSSEKSHG
ncbi:MAG: hypothetical protein QOC81_5120 [Thermoanaerobaculia bacterium]|nr:hypothetical protein [Thermoanaerobaculia bacterium]